MRGDPVLAQPQPEPRARVKRRQQRHAAKVVKSVRQQCVERDGDCRLGDWENNPDDWHADDLEDNWCNGRSEWAHLGEHKRYRTRGQAPEVRHTTAGSLMLCRTHHAAYDRGRLLISALTDLEADGPLEFDVSEGNRYRRAR